MLEPWIIEQIRRREEEARRNERPQLEIPTGDERGELWRRQIEDKERRDRDRNDPANRDDRGRDDEEKPERGVMIIDFGVG
jgi:hypothetical protein